MTMPVAKHRYTIAEYLRFEETAVDRHEFHDGEILAMSGGTYRHSRIVANTLRVVGNRLLGGPCEPASNDLRVRIGLRSRYVYPDATVTCGGATFDPDDPNETTILNPRVVFEVLSDSTESYDRGRKFKFYREIESFEEYVLISQRQPLVETFRRQADGAWQLEGYFEGPDAVARLTSLGIELPLAELYDNIKFPHADTAGKPPTNSTDEARDNS